MLGKGGMGEVYAANHLENGRRLAIKVLNDRLGSDDDRERFLREGRLAASVSHPNCVYIFGSEKVDETLVISMELVRGGSLMDLVEKGPLPVGETVDCIRFVPRGIPRRTVVQSPWTQCGTKPIQRTSSSDLKSF